MKDGDIKNNGAFYRNSNGLRFIRNHDFEGELSYETLGNALVSMEPQGYYLITEVKERKVNPQKTIAVQNGELIGNPYKLTTDRIINLVKGVTSDIFKPLKTCNLDTPKYEEFEQELVNEHHFIQMDYEHFKKEVEKQTYFIRFEKIKKGKA